MPYDPKIGGPGFNETCLVILPNSDLLAVMRTSSGGPLYQSRSADKGRSWSDPVPVGVNGVYPWLVQMSNGVLALGYGRVRGPSARASPSWGNEVIFSLDGGRSWTNKTTIFDGPSTGYPSMIELKPGELLYVYDENPCWPNSTKSVHAVNIKVEKKQ